MMVSFKKSKILFFNITCTCLYISIINSTCKEFRHNIKVHEIIFMSQIFNLRKIKTLDLQSMTYYRIFFNQFSKQSKDEGLI